MNKSIRVLHLGLSDNIGGIESVVHSWLNYKPEWLHFDYIQIGDKPIAFKEDFIADGSSIIQIPSRASDYFGSRKALRNILNEGKYDYLQHHLMSFSWPEPCILANECEYHTKSIMHSHSVISDDFKLKYKILHKIGSLRLNHCEYLRVACSDDAGRAMFSGEDYCVVRNGLDFTECRFDLSKRINIRNELGYKEEDIVIGHVGRSAFEKNYPFLIHSFSELRKLDKRYKLLLVGDILNDTHIQHLIIESGCADSIQCTGPIKYVKQVYSAMDMYYMPSIIEGVSVSLLEAQASGLPCIVSENVSRESDISENIRFVCLNDTGLVLKTIMDTRISCDDREAIKLDDSFDISETSKRMFEIYEENAVN